MLLLSLLALGLTVPTVFARKPSSFLAIRNTLVSAMMVCCGVLSKFHG